ncbi:hypothetical protein PENTCL1PPCAC_28481 [Pristionchus entomophagus]|uniref:Uncharacterized protein n=1 Tax=Pristionchus entomophagus TaxID=358040 RepID=A0AAV5UH85_9BILA|nr:hypothetical protein PENTCL1PPCAC_28481 [Pristionchus entomophagus]
MGGCTSCLRLLLNEADVKIHVIEPTSVMGGANDEPIVIQPSASTLQVPPLTRPRTPTDQSKKEVKESKEDEKIPDQHSGGLQVPDQVRPTSEQIADQILEELKIPDQVSVPVKPKIIPSDSVE